MGKKNEQRNDPTKADGDVMDALQQLDADIDRAIAAQKTDPDRKTDPDDATVSDALATLKSDVQKAILAQSKDGAADARLTAILREVRSAAPIEARVTNEPRVYTAEGRFSYFRDLAAANLRFADPNFVAEAEARLTRHSEEIAVDYRSGNEYVRRTVNEVTRTDLPGGSESRSLSTGATSGGAFVTPQYLIDKWVTYRSPDRTFVNQCTIMPLPTYGITFNIPSFTNYGAAAQQNTENTGINQTNPSGADLSVTLGTFSGAVPVSQQLLDQGGFQGQGGSFDVIVIQQSQDQLYAAVDTYFQQQALSGAQAVTNNSGPLTIAKFYTDFGTARNLLTDTAGVRLPGTHIFTSSDFFAWATSQVAASSGDLFFPSVPDVAALVAVNNDPMWAGWTGIYLPGNYRWFADDNTTTTVQPSNQDVVILGSPLDMLAWVGDMVPFTAQQTNAGELSVLCGLRQYAAAVPRHAEAFSYITGTAYPTSLA